jgi:phosphoenolpyruvate carboxykinase (ATP)
MTTSAHPGDAIRAQLAELGLAGTGAVHRNLPPAELIARSLARAEGILAAEATGLVCRGDINIPCKPALFDRLLDKVRGYLHDRDLYVFDGFAGAERTYRLPIRVVADAAWHALFANTLFVRPTHRRGARPAVDVGRWRCIRRDGAKARGDVRR